MIVASVWVEANVPFTADYVTRLRSMVRRNLSVSHRFVCLTDRPEQLAGQDIEPVRINTPHGRFGWWSKLELFNPAHYWVLGRERVLYLDLDVLVVGSLLPIVTGPLDADLTLIPNAGVFHPPHPYRVVKKYNSSVMTFQAGQHTALYTSWKPAVARRLWGDQDWIGERLPSQPTFPLEWFPRVSVVGGDRRKANGAKVVLCKRPKNHIAAKLWPWIREVWQ